MGRRKKPIEEALELSNEINEEVEETNEEVTEEPAEAKAEEPAEAKEEKKPRRRRSPRKPKAPGLSIENAAAEETNEESTPAVAETIEAEPVAEDLGTEVDNPPTPARGRGRSRKPAGEPDFKKDLVAAATASQKSMDAMAKQWESIREMTTAISSQLEKSSQAIKGIPESIVDAHPELVRAPQQKSQLIAKFAIAASVVAVILSLLSLSLSQSARQAVLSAEVARAAQSMSVNKAVSAPVVASEKASAPIAAALPFEHAPRKRAARPHVFGPETPSKFRARK
ncbi:MAG: hypothetical protein AB7H97_16480 [Pseudobdellovibrionaceae bacterium]